MRYQFRRKWADVPEVRQLGESMLHDMAPLGELVEGWVWGTSSRTCRRMLASIRDQIDLAGDLSMVGYWRLWEVILSDRLEMGDKL